MKTIIYEKYGPPEVLHIVELEKPQPNPNEVLIRIIATTVTAGDWRLRKPSPFLARLYNGLFKPVRTKILGFELAGIIEATGEKVTQFKPGDEVFAFSGFSFGAYAEYKCMPETGVPDKVGILAHKPHNLSFQEAAAVPCGALTAHTYLRYANIHAGQNVMIYGASGSVGTYAVQLAKHAGAELTAVCSSANFDLVKALGADHVLDYSSEEFTNNGQTYDIIYDAVGKLNPRLVKSSLKPEGLFVSDKKSIPIYHDDLEIICDLVEKGAIRPVIEKVYEMEEIIEAHHHVESGHKKGNVVINITKLN